MNKVRELKNKKAVRLTSSLHPSKGMDLKKSTEKNNVNSLKKLSKVCHIQVCIIPQNLE
jgi:hypothetical protein